MVPGSTHTGWGREEGRGKTTLLYGNEKFTAMGNCLLPAGGLQGAVQSMPQHHPTQEERKLEHLSTDIYPCGPGTASRGANTLAFLCCSVWAEFASPTGENQAKADRCL